MRQIFILWVLILMASSIMTANADALKLIPEPQQAISSDGSFTLGITQDIKLANPSCTDDVFAAAQLREELEHWQGAINSGTGSGPVHIGLLTDTAIKAQLENLDISILADKGNEAYLLWVTPNRIIAAGNSPSGTFYAVQTLRQLIRANRTGRTIPCVQILDWPGMPWRGYSDDISRGPIPTMEFFKRQIRTMSEFKMNMLTFYTEHVFRLPKYPFTAPEDGITPEQIAELSAYAQKYHVELVGNFQSFGHFWQFLRHKELSHLAETGDIISPAFEESYEFLDYVYSQIATSYKSSFFNVNCDETFGLGTGPSKAMAEEIGEGGVYLKHVNRIHDILKDKYGKRMMMWGDIALLHPEIVDQVHKDTILLTWGYSAAENYDAAIEPFVKAGLDFMVCPGVSCWSRIFPNYDNATVNIQNYVRDGAKWGAIGMLNTTWDDDGENLFSWNFYGTNWGAACAWRPADSNIEQYNKAFSQLNYGTRDEKITQAIDLLTSCGKNPLTQYNADPAFWIRPSGGTATTYEVVMRQAAALCDTSSKALALLNVAKQDATINAQDIDYLIFSARRLHYIGRHRQLMLIAAQQYTNALDKLPDTKPAHEALEFAVAVAQEIQVTVEELRDEYERLWLAENRPWWLAEMRGRYDALYNDVSALAKKYEDGLAEFNKTGIVPDAAQIGLLLAETSRRNQRATANTDNILPTDLKWWDERWPMRMGLSVAATKQTLLWYPVEVKVNFGSIVVAPESVRVVAIAEDGTQTPLLTQYNAINPSAGTVAFIATRSIELEKPAIYAIYFDKLGSSAKPEQSGSRLTASTDGGSVYVETDFYRLRVGNPGAHVFEWNVKALNGQDVTEPGGASWAGFADSGFGDREVPFEFHLESAGPVLARVRSSSAVSGTEKLFTFYAHMSLMEVNLANPVPFYWDYDAVDNFAADKATPGFSIFSDGYVEPVPASDEKTHGIRRDVLWSGKTRADGFTLANITPGRPVLHMTGPGDGWGGAGIEYGGDASHFVTFVDVLKIDPAAFLNAAAQTLDMAVQPTYTLGAVQAR